MAAAASVLNGQAGAVLIGSSSPGSAVAGKVTKWEYKSTADSAEAKGAEDWQTRAALDKDWEITLEAEFQDDASFNFYDTLLGAACYLGLKRKTGDTNPVIAASGILTKIKVKLSADAPITASYTVVCSEGQAPVFDTTPA